MSTEELRPCLDELIDEFAEYDHDVPPWEPPIDIWVAFHFIDFSDFGDPAWLPFTEEVQAALEAVGMRGMDCWKMHDSWSPPDPTWVQRATDHTLEVAPEYGLAPEAVTGETALVIHAWEAVRQQIRHGDLPRPGWIAELLAQTHTALPDDLRDYVAAVLTGRVPFPPGPSKPRTAPHELCARAVVCHRIARWKAVYQRCKERSGRSLDAYQSALAKVSQETGVHEDTLHSWYYPR